jgi:hypothetical protein
MSVVDDVNLEPFAFPYLIANTPFFLYKRFREVPESRSLAARHGASELVTAFNEHANRVERSDEDVLRAYVALVALSFCNYEQVKAVSERLRPGRLNWGTRLLEILRGTHVPSSVQTLVAPHPAILLSSSFGNAGRGSDGAIVMSSSSEQIVSNMGPLIIFGDLK